MNTLLDFKNKSNEKHNFKYNYDKSIYINNFTKLTITCLKHGDFIQKPNSHYNQGCGCPKCGIESLIRQKMSNIDIFINKANKKHNFRYNYEKSIYVDSITKSEIICDKHGLFLQQPYVHLRGHGCPKCSDEESSKRQVSNKNDFIIKANMIHDNKYDYSLVEYINSKIKIKIICKKHGGFEQEASSHLSGQGCPLCRESKGEKIIAEFLDNNTIKYFRQKKFDDCRYKLPLSFDFYLLDNNICIEFDGETHFGVDMHFKYDKELVKLRDNIKTEYCRSNNIELLRISYKENILKKLSNLLLS